MLQSEQSTKPSLLALPVGSSLMADLVASWSAMLSDPRSNPTRGRKGPKDFSRRVVDEGPTTSTEGVVERIQHPQ